MTLQSKKNKRVRKLLRRLVAGVVLTLAIMAFFANRYYQNGLLPVSADEELVEFTIANGSTLNSVIDQLEDKGLIRDAMVAKVFVRLTPPEPIKAGDYVLNKSWTLTQMLEHVAGNNAIVDQVKVTIPEGTWAKDIAKKISEATNVSSDELLSLWNNKDFLNEMIAKYDFLTADIFKEELRIPLEGFLYPETYYFYATTTPRDVTIKMLDQTKEVLSQFASAIASSKYSVFELVSLASLVQFEANNLVDMKLVSGIFYERMRIGMPLQASATVCYALYEKYKTWVDCEYNIEIESPYNTYYVKGLPVGPISNPGLDAYDAVFHPTESEYLFFVSDVKGDRKNYYAKTYAEHLKNVAKYLD